GAAGPCRNPATGEVAGAPNPDHRDAIDLPGRRFSVVAVSLKKKYVMGTVMF
ncbi:MAG: hypothetical protein JOZ69_13185, partial [Myxococcales bacterium]|nr:hypothetical protein [Myxococcales bacterium]